MRSFNRATGSSSIVAARRRVRTARRHYAEHLPSLEPLETRLFLFGAPFQLFFTQAPPTTLAAGTAFTVKVAIEDSTGNIVTTDTSRVTLSVSGPGTLSGNTIITAIGGVATFANLTLSQVGTYTFQAADTNATLILTTPPQMSITPPAAQLAFAQQPTNTTAGSLFTPTIVVDVNDTTGSLVPSDTSRVTLAIFSGPQGASLNGTTSVTAVGGVATFSDVFLSVAGNYTFRVTDGNLTVATSSAFTINPGTAAKLVFTQQPVNTPAAGIITPALTVAVEDALGNVVTADTSAVTMTLASGQAVTLNGTTTVNAVNGVATFSDLSLAAVGGNYALAASDGSLTGATSSTFAVTGPAVGLVFQRQPSQTTKGSAISPSVIVDVVDAGGNLVAQDSSSVTIAISGTGSITGNLTVAAVHGVATFSNLIPTSVGNYTLLATDGTLTGCTSNTFLVNGPPAKVVFQQQPVNGGDGTAGAAGAALSPAVIVNVVDTDGNIVLSNTSSVTISVLSTSSGGTLSGTVTVAAVNGVASFSNLILSKPGDYTLQATDGILTAAATSGFTLAPAASQLAFGTGPSDTAAGSPMANIVVDVQNPTGNTVPTDTSSVSLAIISGPSSGTMTGATTVAAKAGVATFTGLKFSVPGTYILVAFDSTLDTVTSAPFNITDSPTRLVIRQQPTLGTAGSANALSPVLTVQVLDRHNLVVGSDASTVTLAIATGPTGGLIRTIGSTASGNTTTAIVSGGTATFDSIYFTVAGKYTFTVTDGTLTSATTRSTLVIVPDSANAHLVVTTQPGSTVVGKNFAPTLVVKVEDEFGNIVTADHSKVTLANDTANSTSPIGTLGTLTGSSVVSKMVTVTANNGVATFNNIAISQVGSYRLTLTDNNSSTAPTAFTQIITPLLVWAKSVPNPASVTVNQAGINLTAVFAPTISTNIKFGNGNTSLTGSASLTGKDQLGNPLSASSIAGTVDVNGTVKFASFTAPATAGTYTCTIRYAPNPADPTHTGASATFLLKVKGLVLTVSPPGSLLPGQPFTLTANTTIISGTASASGTVTFMDGATTLGSGSINTTTHLATLTTHLDTAGNHTLTAHYTGDHPESTSAPLIVAVNKAATTISPPGSLTVAAGGSLAFTVSSLAPASTVPTGNVTFMEGNVTLATVNLTTSTSNTQIAVLNLALSTTTGNHNLTATYSGDANDLAATPLQLTVTVT